jgi:O-antigen/teichoic acid export membrane protein
MNTAGINSALIARKDKITEAADSAFIANIVFGILSYGVAWIAAPSVAAFFKAEEITPLFRVLALSLPISGLGLVPYTMLLRGLRFRTKLIPDFTGSLSKGLVSIVLALMGYGPWSLIWGQIVGAAANVLLSWWLAGWRPSWKFNREVAREVVIFGGHIILVEYAGQLRNNVDYLIVGHLLGASALGIYTLAYRIPELAIRSLTNVLGGVSFPLLARIQSDKDTLRAVYFSYIRYVALFSFAVGSGIAIVSRLFTETFLPEDWQPMIIPMSYIAIALAISSVGFIPGVLYKAVGRPQILNQLSLIKIPLIIAIVWVATRWGIVGVAIGQVIFAMMTLYLDNFVASRIIGFTLSDVTNTLMPIVICSLSMILVTSMVKYVFMPTGLLGIILIIATGVVVFFGVLGIIDRPLIIQALGSLKKGFTKA